MSVVTGFIASPCLSVLVLFVVFLVVKGGLLFGFVFRGSLAFFFFVAEDNPNIHTRYMSYMRRGRFYLCRVSVVEESVHPSVIGWSAGGIWTYSIYEVYIMAGLHVRTGEGGGEAPKTENGTLKIWSCGARCANYGWKDTRIREDGIFLVEEWEIG